MPPVAPPPIALTSLKIRDFRGIESLDLDFRGPDGLPNNLVVLAGPNGSGKTAVLEAALIAAGGRRLAVGPSGERAIRNGAEYYSIQASFISGGIELKAGDSSRSPNSDQSIGFPLWYFSSWRAPELVGAVGVTVGKSGRRPAKNDQNRLLNVKQLLTNAAAIERFRPGQKQFEADYSRWVDQINTAWRRFNPGGEGFFVDLVESDTPGHGAFDVFLKAPAGPPLGVDLLSSGQLELFLFLAALVLNDERQGLVFIDEPELHLDPQWHAPIIRSLMELQPKAQFIVATHSPEIYDSAMSYERHFLVPEDDPRAHIWGRAEAKV
jgi:AAA domain, putative AbiEii toxin, Type IV TA system/AAA domain